MASSTEIQKLEAELSDERYNLSLLEQQASPRESSIERSKQKIAELEQRIQAARQGTNRLHQQSISDSANVGVAINDDVQGGIRNQAGGVSYNDNAQHHGDNVQGDKTVFSGNFTNAILNVKSTLENVSQTVVASPNGSATDKQDLQAALKALSDALAQAKPEQKEAVEAVAEIAKEVVDQASKPNPNKTRVSISGEGLLNAAKHLAATMPYVIPAAEQVVNAAKKMLGW